MNRTYLLRSLVLLLILIPGNLFSDGTDSFITRKLDYRGKPFQTIGTMYRPIPPAAAESVLLDRDLYNDWVIEGLNAGFDDLEDPMCDYTRIETSDSGRSLDLYFDINKPFKIEDICIPFTFDVLSQSEDITIISLALKEKNLAMRDASLEISIIESANAETAISLELTVDFTFIVDLVLNGKAYSENMEKRLATCIEYFLDLTSQKLGSL